MSQEGSGQQDEVVYSPRHVAVVAGNNARNRIRTISGSSSNQDFQQESALLDNDDDVIEGQSYRERVVIMTEHEDRAAEDDSGISEAPEDQLLANSRAAENEVKPRKESTWHVAIQVFIPFLIAGFGMMTAGLLLDKVQVSRRRERERERERIM